ncbi:MAG: S-layer homology domain-containing protein [Acidimicrobiia bacterium]|nr:S-layer homology domain-containing protein [Acidimicrobiia bacterium]
MVVAVLGISLPASPSGAVDDPEITLYPGTAGSRPSAITLGPDGTMWFTNYLANSIGRITPTGTISTFTGDGIDRPEGIARGSDGNLWFTNAGNDSVGRITPQGTVSTFTGSGVDQPFSIAAGSDGALWFTNAALQSGNGSIGRVTVGGAVSTFTDPAIVSPRHIALGPDGAMWFSDPWAGSIGRIATDGEVSTFTDEAIDAPFAIAAGSDGAMWFSNGEGSMGRMTLEGTVSIFSGPGIDGVWSLALGADGNLWFTNRWGDSLGRITPAGVVTNRTVAGISEPQGIGADAEGNLWFTNFGNDAIGRVGVATPPSNCGPGRPGPFSDVPGAHAFCVQIAWLATSGVTTGFPDGTFRPAAGVSRQAMAAFLWRFGGEPEVTFVEPFFADVDGSSPFFTAVQWMAESGLSTGASQAVGKPLFRPFDPVSRQAMAAFLWRFGGEPEVTLAEPFFADVDGSSPFFTPVQWMAESGLSLGTPQGTGKPLYKPVDPVSRQAMAAFLYRFDQEVASP